MHSYENLKEENKYYQYDFFFDNCTTRLRDLVVKSKHLPRYYLLCARRYAFSPGHT